MKKLNLILNAALIFTLYCHEFTFAQFQPASISEISIGTGINGRATGNDILDFLGDTYEVSVWEDISGNAGIAYNVNSPSGPSGFIPFTNSGSPTDPDVCLLIGMSTGTPEVHAVAVFYAGSTFFVESYVWNGSGFSLDNTVPIGGTFGTAVNIDSDQSTGQFIIVFDEAVSNNLFAVTGDLASGSVSLYNSGAPVNIGINLVGIYPDVCIFDMVTKVVTYTYVDPAFGDLLVDQDDFNALVGGTSTPNNVGIFNTPNNSYYNPRIACPNPNSLNVTSDDWTVVVLDSDLSSAYEIWGFNFDNNSGPGGPYLYNDGNFNTFNWDLIPEDNYGPVVAYTYDSGNVPTIMVGWNYNGLFSPYTFTDFSVFPIAMQCDERADPIIFEYWEVPQSIPSGETLDYLSLSGRNTSNALHCTFLNATNSGVHSITVPNISAASTLKYTNLNLMSNDIELLGEVYDITGRKLFSRKGTYSSLKNLLDENLKINGNSLYLVKISSEDENIQTCYKLYK